MGLGAVSLRTMVFPRASRLVLGARFGVGARVGGMALGRRLVRLGADATSGGLGNMLRLGCRHSCIRLVLCCAWRLSPPLTQRAHRAGGAEPHVAARNQKRHPL